MGMVPIPLISPLTLARVRGPVLGPPLPVSRVDPESSNAGTALTKATPPVNTCRPSRNPDKVEPAARTDEC